jgi:hypothetical protein
VGSRAVLSAVVKRKIPSPRRESNPRTPIVQPVDESIFTGLFLSVRKRNKFNTIVKSKSFAYS